MTQPSQTPSTEAKTSIDALIELLIEKGKTDLNTISITLGVSPTIIEEWAKVLESGKLIKVNYEVGKMFLEPLAPGTGSDAARSASIKTDAQRSALQNEMEVEKITLDKFSKNLDDLSVTVAGMETLYKQKLPNIQKLFSELDNMAAPIARKTKELDEVQKSAESYFSQLDKKVDTLYVKVEGLQNSDVARALKQKEELLKNSLGRADMAKGQLLDLEDTRQALYSKIATDVDHQVKEFKGALKASLNQIYGDLRADATEAVNIDKEIRTELAETSKIALEAERLRKEAEQSRTVLLSTRDVFKDKYAKIVQEIMQASRGIEQRYQAAQMELEALKLSMGEVSRTHDAIMASRGELDTIQKTIETSKTNVNAIIEALKTLEMMKNKMGEQEKAKAVAELSKKSLTARVKGERIKRSLKDATDFLKGQSIHPAQPAPSDQQSNPQPPPQSPPQPAPQVPPPTPPPQPSGQAGGTG